MAITRWSDDRLDDMHSVVKRTESKVDQLISSGRWTPATIAVVVGPIGAAIIAAGALALGH